CATSCLCTHNAGRPRIAQAFFERYAPPDLRAESAEVGASKSGEEIRACADAILSDYDDAPVRSFVLPRLPAPAGLRRARISSAAETRAKSVPTDATLGARAWNDTSARTSACAHRATAAPATTINVASFRRSEAARLVRPLVTLHRKRVHCSGGELEFCSGLGGAAFAPVGGFGLAPLALGRGVAVLDVVGEGVAEGVPVEVVGVLADELVDGAEGGFDSVEVAGVGRGWHQLDVVGGRVLADRRRPVAGEAVLDPVDPKPSRVGEPDHPHEGERREAVAALLGPDAQVVGVDVERADQVADPLPAGVGGAVALGVAAPRPAAPVAGAEALRPLLVEADHDAVCRLFAVEGED